MREFLNRIVFIKINRNCFVSIYNAFILNTIISIVVRLYDDNGILERSEFRGLNNILHLGFIINNWMIYKKKYIENYEKYLFLFQ